MQNGDLAMLSVFWRIAIFVRLAKPWSDYLRSGERQWLRRQFMGSVGLNLNSGRL